MRYRLPCKAAVRPRRPRQGAGPFDLGTPDGERGTEPPRREGRGYPPRRKRSPRRTSTVIGSRTGTTWAIHPAGSRSWSRCFSDAARSSEGPTAVTGLPWSSRTATTNTRRSCQTPRRRGALPRRSTTGPRSSGRVVGDRDVLQLEVEVESGPRGRRRCWFGVAAAVPAGTIATAARAPTNTSGERAANRMSTAADLHDDLQVEWVGCYPGGRFAGRPAFPCDRSRRIGARCRTCCSLASLRTDRPRCNTRD